MVAVETISKIRRDHFKDGKSIKAIARPPSRTPQM